MPSHCEPRGAVITGASSGIGRATAERLAREGLDVVLTGRCTDALDDVAAACRAEGVVAHVVQLDVRDDEAVQRVLADAVEAYGPGLVVVHAAAVVAYGSFEEVPAEVMTTVVATNVLGTIFVTRAALQAFRRTGGGHLVVVGSLLGEVAAPLMSGYVLSKWAVHGLVRTVQIENRERTGVSVSLVSPGGVDTPIYRRAATVLGRHGSPPPPVSTAEDVADRIVRVLRRPRRQTHVGVANHVVLAGFRFLPAVYDAVATPALRTFALGPWRGMPATVGNVDQPTHHQEHTMTSTDQHASGDQDASSDQHAVSRPRVSRSVAAPAQAVWDVLGDGWLYATWVVGASRVRAVDLDWPAAGTRLHHSVGLWPALISDSTVAEMSQPPHHLVLTARGWPAGEARVEIEVVPDGPGTCTVSVAEDATAGPGRLIPLPVRQLMILPRNREALRRLALLAEGRHREATARA